jgi:hypothetical protein
MRHGLWAEAGRYAELVNNQLVTATRKDAGCPYQQFYNKPWKAFPFLKPFGTIAVVPTSKEIQGKGSDKGVPMIYLGPAEDHAKDVGRFLNIGTKMVIIARPSAWMDVMYGDWKGLKTPKQEEMMVDDAEEDDATGVASDVELADGQPEAPDPEEAPEPDPEVEANPRVL